MSFVEALEVFKVATIHTNERVAPRIAELAAKECALRGFTRPKDMFVVTEPEVVRWTNDPAVKAVLVSLVRLAMAVNRRKISTQRDPVPALAPWWSDAKPASASSSVPLPVAPVLAASGTTWQLPSSSQRSA